MIIKANICLSNLKIYFLYATALQIPNKESILQAGLMHAECPSFLQLHAEIQRPE